MNKKVKIVIWLILVPLWAFYVYKLGEVIYNEGYTDGYIDGDKARTEMIIKELEKLKK